MSPTTSSLLPELLPPQPTRNNPKVRRSTPANTLGRADLTNASSAIIRFVFPPAFSGHAGTGYEKPEDAPHDGGGVFRKCGLGLVTNRLAG